jgi:hypothetical protein
MDGDFDPHLWGEWGKVGYFHFIVGWQGKSWCWLSRNPPMRGAHHYRL